MNEFDVEKKGKSKREDKWPKDAEAQRIGTSQRTSAIWKKNGNLKTFGKLVKERPHSERQFRYLMRKIQAGKTRPPRRWLSVEMFKMSLPSLLR